MTFSQPMYTHLTSVCITQLYSNCFSFYRIISDVLKIFKFWFKVTSLKTSSKGQHDPSWPPKLASKQCDLVWFSWFGGSCVLTGSGLLMGSWRTLYGEATSARNEAFGTLALGDDAIILGRTHMLSYFGCFWCARSHTSAWACNMGPESHGHSQSPSFSPHQIAVSFLIVLVACILLIAITITVLINVPNVCHCEHRHSTEWTVGLCLIDRVSIMGHI